MKSISQEAYVLYSKKASVILKEVSEELKIQADKARNDFTVIARERIEEGKQYISTAAEKSPEEIKDIVEAFTSSTDDLSQISKVQDFYLGIPYGLALCLGGFLSFMVTGSITAIRFGVILGGSLLALSISSLRSQKRGKSFALALKGQTVIAAIIFLREVHLLSQRPSFFSYLTASVSGVIVAFYLNSAAGSRYKRVDSGRQSILCVRLVNDCKKQFLSTMKELQYLNPIILSNASQYPFHPGKNLN